MEETRELDRKVARVKELTKQLADAASDIPGETDAAVARLQRTIDAMGANQRAERERVRIDKEIAEKNGRKLGQETVIAILQEILDRYSGDADLRTALTEFIAQVRDHELSSETSWVWTDLLVELSQQRTVAPLPQPLTEATVR
jgi:hypothetical protein